jgi:hypothetical protein
MPVSRSSIMTTMPTAGGSNHLQPTANCSLYLKIFSESCQRREKRMTLKRARSSKSRFFVFNSWISNTLASLQREWHKRSAAVAASNRSDGRANTVRLL